jgi:hypothetical protein
MFCSYDHSHALLVLIYISALNLRFDFIYHTFTKAAQLIGIKIAKKYKRYETGGRNNQHRSSTSPSFMY